MVGRPNTWKWSLQSSLTDKTEAEKTPGVIYKINCGTCDQCYIGETGRMVEVRVKEHEVHTRHSRVDLSAVAHHAIVHGHQWIGNILSCRIEKGMSGAGKLKKHCGSERQPKQ